MSGPLTNLQQYAIANVQVVKPNGALVNLMEEASLSVEHVTNANPVFTVQKGFAGMSPGSPVANISVESAVPATGFEMDPTSFMADNRPVKFIVVVAGSILQFDGIITESNLAHAVNSEAKLSFKAMGVFAPFQSI